MRRQKGTHGLRHDCSDGHSSARGRDALGNGPVCTRRRRPRRGSRLEAALPVALGVLLISALAKLLGLLSPRDVTPPGPADARTGWWLRRGPAEGTPLAPDPMAGPSEHLWTVEDARLRAGTTEAAASSVRV